ncbi:uncharacterized protein LOC111305657 [Durio zibethinus]|uniref:Uncharacterized protein LOC111305657 n=1 Tax=Durio zibethinus TaxID=66656 RepID=A0A6P6A287_DURZI|nr:uncharacterized protein LOC111305657 [Durio zibethinus]XP_022759107.1 uncharacterized protein LOC111305657 [Durio zibethinus]XP_022759108.1 uncharacterized protein LOC111305657 [Durio zibethinus]
MEGQAEAEASNHNPEEIRGRQPKQRQNPDESKKQPDAEEEAKASNKQKMIRCHQPKRKRQLESPNESEQHTEASSNKPEKRGRKPKLTVAERHANKIQSGRLYRQNKAAKNKALQEKNQELDEEKKRLEEENKELKNEKEAQQFEINSLKEELSKISARADKLERKVSDESKKVNMVRIRSKALEPGMQQLEQNFLNQDDQDCHLEFDDIPMDDEWLNNFENLKDFAMPQNLHGVRP